MRERGDPEGDDSAAQAVHFLLMPGYSVMGFVSAIEPLRVANRFRPGAYRWIILSLDGGPVTGSNGMSLNADSAYGSVSEAQLVFVVAAAEPLAGYQPALARWLRSLYSRGTTLGAIDTGVFVLAEAGLLGADPVTLHWEAQSAFAEQYPQVPLTQELFHMGGRCITGAGGTSGIDMMLALMSQRHGRDLATRVSEQFVLGRIRSQSDHQRMEIAARFGLHNRKTIQVIRLMQQHIEDPLPVDDLARLIGVTRRQLERLFSAHLKQTPARFYVGVRLDRARELLRQTDMGILDVGLACGFGSAAHFSRAYRTHFGLSPKHDRQEP